ncbi:hypothetical protein [Marinoscillum sp.]|uniref:hypothetical protein n=1 Tax=Marinoscillum sp. TaxID=2024838 RepID=UPI003BAD5137
MKGQVTKIPLFLIAISLSLSFQMAAQDFRKLKDKVGKAASELKKESKSRQGKDAGDKEQNSNESGRNVFDRHSVTFSHEHLVDFDIATYHGKYIRGLSSRSRNALQDEAFLNSMKLQNLKKIQSLEMDDVEYRNLLRRLMTGVGVDTYFGGSHSNVWGGSSSDEFSKRRALESYKKSGIPEALRKAYDNLPNEKNYAIINFERFPEYNFEKEVYVFKHQFSRNNYLYSCESCLYEYKIAPEKAEQLHTKTQGGYILVEEEKGGLPAYSLFDEVSLKTPFIQYTPQDLLEIVRVPGGTGDIVLPWVANDFNEDNLSEYLTKMIYESCEKDPYGAVGRLFDCNCLKPAYLNYLKTRVSSPNKILAWNQPVLNEACGSGKKVSIDQFQKVIIAREGTSSPTFDPCQLSEDLKKGQSTEYFIDVEMTNLHVPSRFIDYSGCLSDEKLSKIANIKAESSYSNRGARAGKEKEAYKSCYVAEFIQIAKEIKVSLGSGLGALNQFIDHDAESRVSLPCVE